MWHSENAHCHEVESPADFGYRVRVGAEFSLEATATGEAFTSGSTVVRPDALQPGITDVAVPVFDASGVIAALTVPYVATTFSSVPAADVVTAAERTAAAISRTLRGPGR